MKKITTILFFTLICLFTNKIYAGFITGGELTYTYTGNTNEYLVRLKLFHECQGTLLNTSQTICVSSASCSLFFTDTLYQISSQELLQPYCTLPGPSNCFGGSYAGIEEFIFEGVVNLPGSCMDWSMSYSNCCMGTTNTLSGLPAIYINATLNNVLAPTGSSPQFTFSALPRFCLNANSTYDFSSTDLDGDALSYSFESVMDASGTCPQSATLAGYQISYSPVHPLSSATTITLNSSGIMDFKPNMLQTAVVKVRVNAMASGGITGSIMRQNIVYIVNGSTDIEEIGNQKLSIFPKASKGIFNINLPANLTKKVSIILFNTLGTTIFSKDISPAKNESENFNISDLPSGIYFVFLETDNETKFEKIIKL